MSAQLSDIQNKINAVQEKIKYLEELSTSVPNDIPTLKTDLSILSQFASSDNYGFQNLEIAINENILDRVEKTTLTLDNLFTPEIEDILRAGDLDKIIPMIQASIVEEIEMAKQKVADNIAKISAIPIPTNNIFTGTSATKLPNISQAITIMETLEESIGDFLMRINNLVNLLVKINPNYVTQLNTYKYKIDGQKFNSNTKSTTPYNNTQNIFGINPTTEKNVTFQKLLQLHNNLKLILNDYKAYKTGTLAKQNIPANTVTYYIAGDNASTTTAYNNLKTSFTDLSNKVIADANNLTTEYLTKLSQKGGNLNSALDSIKIYLMKKILEQKLTELLAHYKNQLNQLQKQLSQTPTETPAIDYTYPILSLIAYKFGSINEYDQQLINYCQNAGLDVNAVAIVLIAQKKQDLEPVFSQHKNLGYNHQMTILKLKKMSAEKKFRQDYGVHTNDQMAYLYEKRLIW